MNQNNDNMLRIIELGNLCKSLGEPDWGEKMRGFEAQIPRNGHSIAKIYNEKSALFSPKMAVHDFCRGSLARIFHKGGPV